MRYSPDEDWSFPDGDKPKSFSVERKVSLPANSVASASSSSENRLWCAAHEKLLMQMAPEVSLQTVAARLMGAFSQSPQVMKALYHDTFVSDLAFQARFLGIVLATRCICCHLGPTAVEEIFRAGAYPLSPPPSKKMTA